MQYVCVPYNLVFLFNVGPGFFLHNVREICAMLMQYLQQLLIFPMQYCMEPLGQLAQGFYLWNVCPKLKLVSAIFIIFFIFSPNDSPSKTMKNAFYFIKKALFVLEIIKFFYFRPSLFFSLLAIALEDDRR